MKNIKKEVYRLVKLLKHINYLRTNFYNWDVIIKRAINGESSPDLNIRNGMSLFHTNNNTLHVFKEIFINKVYTSESVDIKHNDVVFDIGANVGVFSLFASNIKGVRVYAFEPHESNYKILVNNIDKNNIKNIECFCYAIGLKNEDRFLVEEGISGGHKLLNKKMTLSNSKKVKVKSVRLETAMENLNLKYIDFLKLDCEGAEGEIIQSLGIEGLKKIDKIAMEFHDNHSILNHEEIINHLKIANFDTLLKWDGKSSFGYIYAKNKEIYMQSN